MSKFMLFTQFPVLVWWMIHQWEMKGTDGVIEDGTYDTGEADAYKDHGRY